MCIHIYYGKRQHRQCHRDGDETRKPKTELLPPGSAVLMGRQLFTNGNNTWQNGTCVVYWKGRVHSIKEWRFNSTVGSPFVVTYLKRCVGQMQKDICTKMIPMSAFCLHILNNSSAA